YFGSVHFTSSDPGATLPHDATLSGGAATFSATLRTAGGQSLTVTDVAAGGLTASGVVSVAAAAATHFTVSAPGAATAGTPLALTVTALDAYGNTATGYAGTVHFTSTDPGAALPADAGLMNGLGTFAATFTGAGLQTISAADV